jgi:hypothetical protein
VKRGDLGAVVGDVAALRGEVDALRGDLLRFHSEAWAAAQLRHETVLDLMRELHADAWKQRAAHRVSLRQAMDGVPGSSDAGDGAAVVGPPVFILGRFRSGTSMFWQLFRNAGEFHCLFEPLHEQLPDMIAEPPLEPDWPEYGNADAFREYLELDRIGYVLMLWRSWFGSSRFLLGPGDDAVDLGFYLRNLLRAARRRPVAKFVQCDFRAGWLRAAFPDAVIVGVERQIRDVWRSSGGQVGQPSNPQRAPFLAYTERMADDLGVPPLDHGYQRFYLLTTLAHRSLRAVADHVWTYDAYVSDPVGWSARHLPLVGLDPDVGGFTVPSRRALDPAENAWFDGQERTVGELLAGDGSFIHLAESLTTPARSASE